MAHGQITASTLNLRTAPDPSSATLGSFSTGTIVEILGTVTGENYSTPTGTNNQWNQVKVSGKDGFMAASFIIPVSNPSDLTFDLPAPSNAAKIKELNLWSTFYLVHQAKASNDSSAIPLRNVSGNPLGPKLSQKDWCTAALEGTVRVENPVNVFKTFNFAKQGATAQANCSFPSLDPNTVKAMNRSLFMEAKGLYGDGSGGFILVPYRTIAVDKAVIPLGTVIFIADARGKEVTLPSGNKIKHDGYFFAADVGGAIKGDHVDTFLGITDKNPFSHVKSSPTPSFKAFIIKDSQIENTLKNLHRP